MRRSQGFTLLELMTVIAIVGVLSAIAFGVSRMAQRNAHLSSATFELALKVSGLKAKAISDQTDYLLVLVDGADPEACGTFSEAGCTRYFVLRNPTTSWTLTGFSPASAATDAEYVEHVAMPRGVALDGAATAAPPPPFDAIPLFDSALTKTISGKKRFAFRFARDGSVSAEGATAKPGYAFALTSDPEAVARDRRGVVVAFPAGIVRTFVAQ